MKKLIAFVVICLLPVVARASCVATTKTYTACKSGYYLTDGVCKPCLIDLNTGDLYANVTSPDGNTGPQTVCYIPAGTSFSDDTGSGTYASNCNYSE